MAAQQRIADLVVSRVGPDTVVFDQRRNHVHTLPAVVAGVWAELDGVASSNDIARTTGRSCDEIEAMITQLGAAGLLEDWAPPVFATRDRRSLLRKAAIGAAIVSVTAPLAAQAQSAGQIACATSVVIQGQYYCKDTVSWGTYDCVNAGCPAQTEFIYNDAATLKDGLGNIVAQTLRHRCESIAGSPISVTPWSPTDPSSFPTCS